MKTHIIPRGGGKTTKLIEMSAKSGSHIVCHNKREANRINRAAKESGLKIPFPVTYDEFINKQDYLRGSNGFMIDNVDMLLQSITDIPITDITASN